MFNVRIAARYALFMMVLTLALPGAGSSQQSAGDLGTPGLENLLSTEVASVSRHQEELRKAPAPVYVISQEDIRRSGATDVAELLRMVPGVQVEQINSNVWAVGVRGFGAEYSKQVLLLVDGRSVYDPIFSGVFWRTQNLLIEDIDRIEVIRGPGATMWGANAVNGVISITTKNASNTQGGLFVADSGNGRPAEGSVRFGGSAGKTALYRVFGRQTTRSSFSSPSGANGLDSWNMTSGGFRMDWNPSKTDSVTFEAGAYHGLSGSNRNALISLSPAVEGTRGLQLDAGGNFLTRWSHSFRNSSNLTLQAYADKAREVSTVDFDLQYSFRIGRRSNMMAGVGGRRYSDTFNNSITFGLTPSQMDHHLTTVFVQNEIALVRDRLYVTTGTRIEDNSFSGRNAQPSVHLAWLPSSRQSAWVSASRAIRAVNRIERDAYVNMSMANFRSLPVLVNAYGQQSARSEGLLAYEAGYRYQVNRELWFDITSFYNVYDHLSTIEPGAMFFENQPAPGHYVAPLYFGNGMKGETYGTEAAAQYKLTPSFTVNGSYSLLHMTLRGYNGHVTSESTAGRSPQHQAYIGPSLKLPRSFQISGNAYFVSGLPAFQIPAHTRVDVNVGWRGLENLEFNVVGQNLFGSHKEFGDVGTPANVIRPGIYGKVTWVF